MRSFVRQCPSLFRVQTQRPRHFIRSVHNLRELPYNIEDGLGDFLPPSALKVVALDFQQGLLERLNDEVRGTEEENKSVAQTVINTAADRSKAMAFNYASLALNNSFFLDMLHPPAPPPLTSHESKISPYLSGTIRSEHGSLDQLKSNFSAAALGMSSSGWVWFVTDRKGNTGVLPTFGSGTLLIRSRTNTSPILGPVLGERFEDRQKGGRWGSRAAGGGSNPDRDKDNSLSSSPSSFPTSGTNPSSHPPNSPLLTRSMRSQSLDMTPASIYGSDSYLDAHSSGKDDITGVGEVLSPLFCVSVHEHAWMSAGFGVWGKEEWLKRFWTVLDWEKVSRAFENFAPNRGV